jgi:hypothetical protein
MKKESLSFKEINKILTDLAISQTKTHEEAKQEFKELRQSQAETSAQMKKYDILRAEVKRELKQLSKEVKAVNQAQGGLGKSIGDQTEEFFYQGFKRDLRFHGMKFDNIDRNIQVQQKEYDIVLYNGDSLALISVKHKLRQKDVDQFIKKDIPAFTEFFPQYKNHTLYAGMASLSAGKNTYNYAAHKGLVLYTQSGESPLNKDIKDFQVKKF